MVVEIDHPKIGTHEVAWPAGKIKRRARGRYARQGAMARPALGRNTEEYSDIRMKQAFAALAAPPAGTSSSTSNRGESAGVNFRFTFRLRPLVGSGFFQNWRFIS